MTGADWLSSVFPETDQRRFCVFSPVSSASEAATSLIYGSFRQFGNTTSPTYGTKSGKRRVYALEFRSSYSAYCGKGAIYKPPSKNQLFESAINKPDRHPCGDFSLDLRHPPIHHRDFKGTIPEERPNGICQYPEHTWYAPFLAQPLRFCSRQCTFATAPEPCWFACT